jgi:hypothetical protein
MCAFGMSLAIVWMAVVVIMAILADVTSGYGMPFVTALQHVYIGYNGTWLGIIIGAFWAFIDGFVGGAAIAWFYNTFAAHCKKCN